MDKVKRIQKNVEASMAVEGLKPSDEVKELNKKYLKGEITGKEVLRRVKEMYLGGKNGKS